MCEVINNIVGLITHKFAGRSRFFSHLGLYTKNTIYLIYILIYLLYFLEIVTFSYLYKEYLSNVTNCRPGRSIHSAAVPDGRV